MTFRLVIVYLMHLLKLIEAAEELGAHVKQPGEDKKQKVLQEYMLLLSELPKAQAQRIPRYLRDPEWLARVVDLLVLIANLILGKKNGLVKGLLDIFPSV